MCCSSYHGSHTVAGTEGLAVNKTINISVPRAYMFVGKNYVNVLNDNWW